MTREELKTRADWIAKLFKVYQHIVDTPCTDETCDRLLAETGEIWEASGRDEMVCDMAVAIVSDVDRRWRANEA